MRNATANKRFDYVSLSLAVAEAIWVMESIISDYLLLASTRALDVG